MSIAVNPNDCLASVGERINEGLSQVRQWGGRLISYAPSLEEVQSGIVKFSLFATDFFLRFSLTYIGVSTIVANPTSMVLIVPALIVVNTTIAEYFRMLRDHS
ncbi:MAG: hypothetical protein FJZ57_01955 [Chlamydiae bacterium]|nr:hypothetical protein [Chlamydiota bacterium]